MIYILSTNILKFVYGIAQLPRQNVKHGMKLQKTPHILPFWASYGVYFVTFS